MDSNKDEAFKCIDLAKQYVKEKARKKAEKFLQKAERLYPTDIAKDLLQQLSLTADNDSQLPPTTTDSQPRQRHSATTAKNASASDKTTEYTNEQLTLVKRINDCKDYYQILDVKKDSPDSDIRKAYKKLALQCHPDKNQCPGAAEAFKSIGNAVAVLIDPEKRKHYDTFGLDEGGRGGLHGRTSRYSRAAYAAEFDSDEIFNMFFGGVNAANNMYFRGSRWQRASPSRRQEHHTQRGDHSNNYTALFQILPILLAILLSLLSNLMMADPVYSLHYSQKYPVERVTQNLKVPYYVKKTFNDDYQFQGSVKRLEQSVEEEVVYNLRVSCIRERSYRETLARKAVSRNDQVMYNEAHKVRMPSCDKLRSYNINF